MAKLEATLDRLIAESYGIRPEEVTLSFVDAMSRRIAAEPSGSAIAGPAERARWDERCRGWAREFFSSGSTARA